MARVARVWSAERLKDTADLLELGWPLTKIAYAIRVHPQALYSRLATDPVLRALRKDGDRVQVVDGKRSVIAPLPAVAARSSTTFMKRSRNFDINQPIRRKNLESQTPGNPAFRPLDPVENLDDVPLTGQRLIPLAELTTGVCHWPSLADPAVVGGQRFCGLPTPGRYCVAHAKLAFPPRSRDG